MLDRNIRRMRERSEATNRSASLSERLSDRITRFAGSMTFVIVHAVVYAFWIGANVGLVPGLHPFDPSLVVLAMEASVEAIFLSTFVLISQNRMMGAAARQSALDLQINLLSEHELTRLVVLVDAIAHKLDVEVTEQPAVDEAKEDVSPEVVLDQLDDADRDG